VAGAQPFSARSFDLSEIEGISQRTLEMHQQVYRRHVDAVNALLHGPSSPSPAPVPSSVSAPSSAGTALAGAPASAMAAARFAHEYNGMVLHELFFEELTGALGAIPPRDGTFARAVDACFGSFDAWKADIRARAAGVEPGWVLCVRERAGQRLFNCRIDGHAIGLPAADVVLVLDLWEHAWLPDHGPAQREDYVAAVLTQIDWAVIERRCRGEYGR
jgi:superoxide dismutase, Fe-Mn family